MEQVARFCASRDGVRIAYATHGRGPVLVKVANWMTHIEHDWTSPLWRPWWDALAEGHRVVRYDTRGCGLSDRDPARLDLDALVDDLAAVVDALGAERFALVGLSQGGATALAYAARHPERVTHLVLCGAYARGRARRAGFAAAREEAELLASLISVGWGRPEPSFRRVFTTRLVPDADLEQMRWLDDAMRSSTTPEVASRLREAWGAIDVTGLLDRVTAPALVAHARGDLTIPFEEGRLLATRLPDAQFLPLESRNHILLAGEPAWSRFLGEMHAFTGARPAPAIGAIDELSAREREVLTLVTHGLTNAQIAGELCLSVRTVERHLANVYAKLRISGLNARAAAAAYMTRAERAAR